VEVVDVGDEVVAVRDAAGAAIDGLNNFAGDI
jgi:hypothetical protein